MRIGSLVRTSLNQQLLHSTGTCSAPQGCVYRDKGGGHRQIEGYIYGGSLERRCAKARDIHLMGFGERQPESTRTVKPATIV